MWAHMCTGQRENGTKIEANDPIWSQLETAALAAKARPDAWLEQRQIYGEIADHDGFREAFSKWLRSLNDHGVDATIEQYLDMV